MKAKITATLRLRTSGEVVGEIVNENGEVVSSRLFGEMTENDFRKGLKQVEKLFSEVASTDVSKLSETRPLRNFRLSRETA